MRRPPRQLTDRVIDRQMQLGVLLVGLVMALATLLTIDLKLPRRADRGLGRPGRGAHGRLHRAGAGPAAQHPQLPLGPHQRLPGLFSNRWLWAAIGRSLLLQVLVVHVPILNRAFDTTPPSTGGWALCVAKASSVLWADALKKLLLRWTGPRR